MYSFCKKKIYFVQGLKMGSVFAGWILIDRSGRHFGTILNYLRDGSVSLPESQRELEEVLSEARYYLIQGLAEDCQLALQVKWVSAWQISRNVISSEHHACCSEEMKHLKGP